MLNDAVSNTAKPGDFSKPDYFTTRLTKAQLAYEREIAGLEMLEKNIFKLLRKLSPEEVADVLEVPLDQVNKIAAKQKGTY